RVMMANLKRAKPADCQANDESRASDQLQAAKQLCLTIRGCGWCCHVAVPTVNRITRHEDFQSSCCTGTMCHYRSLCVSIQTFNGASSRSILPIRTHRDI